MYRVTFNSRLVVSMERSSKASLVESYQDRFLPHHAVDPNSALMNSAFHKNNTNPLSIISGKRIIKINECPAK